MNPFEAIVGAAIESGRLTVEKRGKRLCLVAHGIGFKITLSEINTETMELTSEPLKPITAEDLAAFHAAENPTPPPAPKRGPNLRIVQ